MRPKMASASIIMRLCCVMLMLQQAAEKGVAARKLEASMVLSSSKFATMNLEQAIDEQQSPNVDPASGETNKQVDADDDDDDGANINVKDMLTEETIKLSNANQNGRFNQSPISNNHDKRLFVIELLKILHEQYGSTQQANKQVIGDNQETTKRGDRQSGQTLLKGVSGSSSSRQAVMTQLLGAIGADGDIRRLIDWIQNSFTLASVGELTTQFVVSKLGSINCAALLTPDSEETLIPRFLLFNDHFVDVPFELPIKPTSRECLTHAKFDPSRKTIVLIHGYLAGYTLVDGLTNIKNRLLDINKLIAARALRVFTDAAKNNGSYVLTEDLEIKVRQQQYNVIIVDWFNGANPMPRANYIRAAVNAQVVGKLIARFLSSLVVQCKTPSRNIQIIAHSLGCHVAGFTGKAMNAAGHQMGKIVHLDPIGLCFGRLFSQPAFRLNLNDAHETQAIHVSMNLFDNPLDGAQSNFLVNGGRDQAGCQPNELKNSTSSSVALLYDSDAKFAPCSHVRALSLFEDDLSSEPGQCQIVGYRCSTYERFLAGKCGKCDLLNGQCRLMSLPPIFSQFNRLNMQQSLAQYSQMYSQKQQQQQHPYKHAGYTNLVTNFNSTPTSMVGQNESTALADLVGHVSNGSIAWLIDDKELNQKIGNTIAKLRPELIISQRSGLKSAPMEEMTGKRDENFDGTHQYNEIKRADRKLTASIVQRDRIAQAIGKIATDTKQALVDGWSSFAGANVAEASTRYKITGKLLDHLPSLSASSIQIPISIGASNSAAKETEHQHQQQQHSLGSQQHHQRHPQKSQADHEVLIDVQSKLEPPPVPLGSQPLPPGAVTGPLYFVGTAAISPFCVNYYQFRLLIAEARLSRLQQQQQAQAFTHPNRLHAHEHSTILESSTTRRSATINNKDMLHFTIKLVDSLGQFFKGFTLLEDARTLTRVAIESKEQRAASGSEFMLELTMLLNTTKPEPVRISESIISYYFHNIILADQLEVNYMSNISPEVRARYSSVLCPVAINDQHQLVKYVECHKTAASAARRK